MAKAKSNFSFDVVKKNLFWICVPLAVIIMWGIFIVANSKAKADYQNRMNELEELKEKVGTIKSDQEHPNTATIEAAKVEEQRLREIVYRAWEEMYRDQQKFCKWSTELPPDIIAFIENKKWLSPIPDVTYREAYHTFVADTLPEYLEKVKRRTVAVRVEDHNTKDWKKDAEGNIIYVPIDPYVAEPLTMMKQNAQSLGAGAGSMGGGGGMPGSGAMGGVSGGGMGGASGGGFTSFSSSTSGMGGGGMGGMGGSGGGMGDLNNTASGLGLSMDNIYDSEYQLITGIVDWPTPEIYSVVTWSGQSPYSVQIWYAQEELWVYESLLNVIERVNSQVNAKGPHNAAVKRINAILIGRNASPVVSSPGILEPLGSFSGGSMMGDMMGDMMGMGSLGGMDPSSSGMMMDGMDGMAGMSGAPVTEEDFKNLLERNRYVDTTMMPLADTTEAPFTEFNMMPVCLELIVDQRKIPDVLIACANSTMPIDVKLVRYSPGYAKTGILVARSTGGMDGGGMMMGGGPMGGSPMGGSSMGGGTGALGAGTDAASQALESFEVGGKIGPYGPDAVMIQIIGIIYIYNEPDPEVFAKGTSAQESGTEGGVNASFLEVSLPPENTGTTGASETAEESETGVPPTGETVTEENP